MPAKRPIRWKDVAAAVGTAIPRERLHRSVVDWARNAGSRRPPWAVALSGGADSVALLLLIWAHWPDRRRTLSALHFDHRLRGAASRGDVEFSRKLCRSLGVRFVVGRWDRPAKSGDPSEAEARQARLAFFGNNSRVLWLGHHKDDVAETMLMRVARGSGTGGLSAPRPVQPMPSGRVHLRPLLGLPKAEIVAVLQEAGAAWREDATNAGRTYFRNRIRAAVIPAWVAAAQRDAVAGAARSRELLEEDDEALENWVDQLAPFAKSGDLLLNRLAGVPRAVARRALHRWLSACRPQVDVSRQAFDALLAAVQRGIPTRHSLGREMFAVIANGRLKFKVRKPKTRFQRGVN